MRSMWPVRIDAQLYCLRGEKEETVDAQMSMQLTLRKAVIPKPNNDQCAEGGKSEANKIEKTQEGDSAYTIEMRRFR